MRGTIVLLVPPYKNKYMNKEKFDNLKLSEKIHLVLPIFMEKTTNKFNIEKYGIDYVKMLHRDSICEINIEENNIVVSYKEYYYGGYDSVNIYIEWNDFIAYIRKEKILNI